MSLVFESVCVNRGQSPVCLLDDTIHLEDIRGFKYCGSLSKSFYMNFYESISLKLVLYRNLNVKSCSRTLAALWSYLSQKQN